MPPETPGAQTALGDAGACPEITWDGKVWRLGHPTQRAKAALEELGAAAALANVRHLPDDDPDRNAVRTAVRTGAYRTFNTGWQETVNGEGTRHLFVLSLFRERHPDMTEDECLGILAECTEDVLAGVARVAPDFFRLLLRDPKVPPARRAELEPLLSEVSTAILSALSSPPTPATVAPADSGSSTPTG